MRDLTKNRADVKSMFSLKNHRRKNKRNVKLFEKKELFKWGEINLTFCVQLSLCLWPVLRNVEYFFNLNLKLSF